MTRLEDALTDYDGKHTDVLEQLRDEFEPKAAVLRQAVRLSVHDDAKIAQGATWLLLAWVERGAQPTAKIVTELAERLPQLTDKWVLLHVARCVPLLPIAAAHVGAFAAFLERCRQHSLPFVRTWGLDKPASPGVAAPYSGGASSARARSGAGRSGRLGAGAAAQPDEGAVMPGVLHAG